MELDQNRDPVIKELINNQTLTDEQVTAVEQEKTQNIQEAFQSIAGKEYLVNLVTYQLICTDTLKKTELFSLQLPKPNDAKMAVEEWEKVGTDWTIFELASLKKEADIPWKLQNTLGFVDSAQGTYLKLDENGYLTSPYLALSTSLVFAGFPKNKGNSLPLDLFWSRNKKYLVVSDRGAGVLHIVDLQAGKLLNSAQVRNPGATKAINLAIAEEGKKIYVSDHSTAQLNVIDLNNFSMSKLSPGVGILGNLIITPDEKNLFLVATKPKPGLKVFELASNSVTKEIALKGDLFSTNSDNPCDLMSLTPNGEDLLFTTYLNDPKPFTPVISVIKVNEQKTTARFSIKDNTSPALLAFSLENPVEKVNEDLIDMLLDRELMTEEQVRQARIAIRQREMEEQMRREAEANPIGQMLDLDQRNFEEMEKGKNQEEEEEEVVEGAFVPQKAEQRVLSSAGVELIVAHCVKIIYSEMGAQIDSEDEYAEALSRLKMASNKALNEMEWYNGAVIKLKDLIEEYTFKTTLQRETVENWLHIHERDSLVKSGLKTIPSNCPNCTKPLFGSYICSNCGYKIESPEELLKRGLISIASASPMDYLPKGHNLLVDMQHKRIIEVDINHDLVWELGTGTLTGEVQIDLEFPRDAVRLATRNTLITDYVSNRVVEMTPRGRVFWELNTSFSPDHQLKNPVKATSNGLNQVLVVDQGHHRVLEVDRDQEIVWKYGEKDNPGIVNEQLNMPSDAQRLVNGNVVIADTGNHRIIEVEKHKIVWQYGNPENEDAGGYGSDPGLLCYPQSALRMDNGNTLIVDSGNARVIEINKENQIIWQHNTSEGSADNQVDAPFKAAKLPNGIIVILGETSVIEVDQFEKDKDKAVIWSCKLSEFEVKREAAIVQHKVKRGFLKHGVSKDHFIKDNEEELQKKREMELKMQEVLKQRMAARKAAEASKAHVALMKGAKVAPIDFFLVDRSRNRILRTRRDGSIVWRYGEKPDERLNKPHTCLPVKDGNLLISDTDHHRVFALMPKERQIMWEYGQKGQPGKGANQLNRPRSVAYLDNDHVLIADQNNGRVIEVNLQREVVWSLEGLDNLVAPFCAQRLPNGNTLISDWGAHFVFEVNPQGQKVWQFGERKVAGNDETHIAYPEFAARLTNGNTLITDSRNGRIVEVNPSGVIEWQFAGDPKNKLSGPTYARRLKDGNTLIVHNQNRNMYEVDGEGTILWKYMLPMQQPTTPGQKPPPAQQQAVPEKA